LLNKLKIDKLLLNILC